MRIVFCGVGALGSHAALACRNLSADLAFIDFDRVESKNLLSQAYVKQSIGKNKAEALKLQLQNFYGVKSESFPVRLTNDNVEALTGKADLVVDGFDNAASRDVLSRFARAHGKALVHAAIAADASFGMVRWDARFTADKEDSEGQATCENGAELPMLSLVSSALARAVQEFATSKKTIDFMISRFSIQSLDD
jgi:molybdopterin-synthase adenylyltransferase